MSPSKQKLALFTLGVILKNTILKCSVTKSQPQLGIVLVCKALVIYWLLL